MALRINVVYGFAHLDITYAPELAALPPERAARIAFLRLGNARNMTKDEAPLSSWKALLTDMLGGIDATVCTWSSSTARLRIDILCLLAA